ncbi:VOC family protein [uncultured Jannaschia sp.]|uniref:VOC family protein n=1 Tax=uncultured Jannaschia sp. TaxID=293347 RepID=UPI00263178B0|nr:VOC family protein [uncultured Jannaschia sp.]
MSRVSTCLWFADNNGHEAAAFWCDLLPDSRIVQTMPGEGDAPLAVAFELMGTPYQALNGGPRNRLGEETSIVVATDDQAETDRLWDALSDGGEVLECGWLIDRFGVRWQIAPEGLWDMTCDPDRAAAGRAFAAMMTMTKIDIGAVRAAFEDR